MPSPINPPAPTDLDAPSTAPAYAAITEAIRRHHPQGEALRALPPAIAEVFRTHDVYRLLLPPDLGGAGLDVLDYFDLVIRIARLDGACGWNFAIGAGGGVFAGFLDGELARAMFAAPDCCVAGAVAPMGRGRVAPGGFRLDGRWAWGSGMAEARWVVAGFQVVDEHGPRLEANGQPMIRQALIDKAQVRVLDTWQAMGLRGTGSTDYEIEDAFVPEGAAFKVFAEPRHPAAVFRLPSTFFGAAIAAPPLGIAEGAIAALARLASDRQTSGGVRMTDQPFTLQAIARAQALVESAHDYLRAALAETWRSTVADEPYGLALRARTRRASVLAAEASVEAADLCARAAGGAGVLETHPFARAVRDTRTALAHVMVQPWVWEDAGRVAFGLPPASPRF